MPFLGPAIVAWIVLVIGVMGWYFWSTARQHRPRDVPAAPEVRLPSASWARPSPPPFESPAYEMEDFPQERWDASTAQS
jgi:hypothetical protein